jgi:hypothetical protein
VANKLKSATGVEQDHIEEMLGTQNLLREEMRLKEEYKLAAD